LNEGRALFPGNREFGEWCRSAKLAERVHDHDRAAAMWAAGFLISTCDLNSVNGFMQMRSAKLAVRTGPCATFMIPRMVLRLMKEGRNSTPTMTKALEDGATLPSWKSTMASQFIPLIAPPRSTVRSVGICKRFADAHNLCARCIAAPLLHIKPVLGLGTPQS